MITNKQSVRFLGSHLSLAGPSFYEGTVKRALEWHEDAFMFYTGAPQNSRRLPLEKMRIEEGRKLLEAAHFDESKIVIHAPYIINLANDSKEENYAFGINFIKQELNRAAAFGVSLLVLHPGCHLEKSPEESVICLAKALNEILKDDASNVTIALETMAGKGSEMGTSFTQLASIRKLVKKADRIGVCLDTCHINDEGMNVKDVDGVLDAFEASVGLASLKVIHLNDSKNVQGSHKDRHENIGYGTIGFETLEKWASSPRLNSIPKILETPVVGDKYPYAQEIQMLRSGSYLPSWREKL